MEQPSARPAYRPDIDGLRALAVIAVIAFHAAPEYLGGGFAGVDVFFVISGFLITSILQRELATATFSIRRFYARRLRRLVPALVVVLVATLAAGYALLLEDEYRQLGWHVTAGTGFFSNLALWSEVDYFARASEYKPLLHLWSLGIEEQFYFVWPLLLWLAVRLRKNLLLVAAVIAVASFSANVALVAAHPETAFFMPFARFWELMLGGMLALGATSVRAPGASATWRTSPLVANAAALIGVGCMGWAMVALGDGQRFPGWWALLPTLGTTLLIWAGPTTWLARWVLAQRPLVYIGLISYPLYLWHWPLLTFARLLYADLPPLDVRFAVVAAAFALAALTFRFVETPLRHPSKNPATARRQIAGLAASLVMLFGIGLLVHQRLPRERLAAVSDVISAARKDWTYPRDAKAGLPGTMEGTVLFFGDSYIQQLYPAVAKLADSPVPHFAATFHTAAGCAPIPGLGRVTRVKCAEYVKQGYELAAGDDIKTVVLGASWMGMVMRDDIYETDDRAAHPIDLRDDVVLRRVLGRLEQTLARLIADGKAVVIVLHHPGGALADPEMLGWGRLHGGAKLPVKVLAQAAHEKFTGRINTQLAALASRLGATVIDPATWMCADGSCALTDNEGVPYYKDSNHLRASFVSCCARGVDRVLAPSLP